MTEPDVLVNDNEVVATEVVVVPNTDPACCQEVAADESVELSDPRRQAEHDACIAAANEATAQGRTADAQAYNDMAAALHA